MSTYLENVRMKVQSVFERAQKELEASREKKVELEDTIRELKEKMNGMNRADSKENVLTSIVGSWNIVSSIGMKEFLAKRGARKEFDAIFQVETQNFEVDGDLVTMYNSIGITDWRGKYTIGAKTNGTYMVVEDNMLVSIYFGDDYREEYMRMERFVKNGQLHVVTKRFGLKCTRIYEKVGSKDSEAAKKIAELEAELEKLNLEMKVDKEELIKEKEEAERIRECLREKTSEECKLLQEISKLEKEKEELREEIKLVQEKPADKEPVSIETAILGTWQLVQTTASKPKSEYTIFLIEDGHITESNPLGDKRTSWVLNDSLHSYNYSLFAHSAIVGDKYVTDFYKKWGGAFEYAIERRIENGMLEIVKIRKNGMAEKSVYKRVN